MSIKYVTLNCPSCGAPVDDKQERCSSCGARLLLEIDNTGTSLLQIKSLLEISRYSEATEKCSEILSHGIVSADVYYYLCIALLEGKKPYVQSRNRIDECIDALDRALTISDKGIIYLLRAYIEYDYFERKYLNRNPNYKYFLANAKSKNISDTECKQLENLVKNKISIGGSS